MSNDKTAGGASSSSEKKKKKRSKKKKTSKKKAVAGQEAGAAAKDGAPGKRAASKKAPSKKAPSKKAPSKKAAGAESKPEASRPDSSDGLMSKTSDPPPRWAADEPTAMWDESALASSGYEEIVEHRSKEAPEKSAPATGREVGGDSKRRVEVSPALAGRGASSSSPRGLSWVATLLIAGGLGLAVYFIARMLR